MSFVLIALCVGAFVSCIMLVGTGFLFGRASARPHVKQLATLRLKQDVEVDDGKGQESTV